MKTYSAMFALVALLLTGCTTELYHGLSESEANEMVVALEQHGFQATKARDSADPERWMVSVPTGVKVEAMRVLESRGLPRPDVQGFGSFYPSQGLIPTSGEERVLLQYATAQELRQSLLSVDGVVDAHVNLVLPEKPRVRLETQKVEKPRASVLVKYRRIDDARPIDENAVRKLVAGGVEGLDESSVTVIMSQTADSEKPIAEPKLVQVGPVSVAPANQTMLQILIVGMIGVIIALAGLVGFLLMRRRG